MSKETSETPKIQLADLTGRKYLEEAVVPILTQALEQLVKERPANSVTALEWLAKYLVENKNWKEKLAADSDSDQPN
ncbi:unnamed protein product [Oikopleura dioica]|nr:unnamed protein product [Oikopleura dioica]